MLDLLSSIVVHPTLCHLLRLPVFSSDNGSAGGDETTLASLITKLREITKMYQKTAKLVKLIITKRLLIEWQKWLIQGLYVVAEVKDMVANG